MSQMDKKNEQTAEQKIISAYILFDRYIIEMPEVTDEDIAVIERMKRKMGKMGIDWEKQRKANND